MIPTDEELRELLDERGQLRPGALMPPPRTAGLTVFAQRTDAHLELSLWERHAERFFAARVGLAHPKRYDDRGPPVVDAASVVVAPDGEPPGTRFCFARPREPDDLAAAEVADARKGSPGLALLAARCGYVWLVATQGEDDRLALRLAAVIASVVLGPVLSASQEDLFGVRTARLMLERPRASPYRG